jgi:tRNA nucleotidyltransferase (CCA-adding enzyme)
MDGKALYELAERFQMSDQESRQMIAQRLSVTQVLEELYRLEGKSPYALYTLLSQYDTDILLFMMAKADNENIKRLISLYFTKLRGTETMLTGKDLKALGLAPGPLYREVFDRLLEARLNNRVNTKDDELDFVRDQFLQPSEA